MCMIYTVTPQHLVPFFKPIVPMERLVGSLCRVCVHPVNFSQPIFTEFGMNFIPHEP